MESCKPPTGLGPRGRKLWRSVTGQYKLTPSEVEVLHLACSTADQVARIELRLKAVHVTSTGSTGQLTAHPLLAEFRLHSDTLRTLLKQLNLPDMPDIDRKRSPRKSKINPGKVTHLMGGA